MLSRFFSARSVAIIGASHKRGKIGNVMLNNFLEGKYKGKVFLINPNVKKIHGRRCYASVLDVKTNLDLAVIAIPAEAVLEAVGECGKAGIKNVIIISAGFREAGRNDLENKLKGILRKYNMRVIGPNCLGIFDGHTHLDTLFLPRYRLSRPEKGNMAFVCQSGAVGSAILDYATEHGCGFSKFISYGNAMDIDESDLIEFLGNDKSTKVICVYLEGAKNGKKLLNILRKVSKKKPIVVIKGGKSEQGNKAAMSHTGSLAGSAAVYSGVFKQANVVEAQGLEEMFEYAAILDSEIMPKGNRVQVITNGGGYGILSIDAIVENNLRVAKLSNRSLEKVKKKLPGIQTENPLDLLGDADDQRYQTALDIAIRDKNVDIILLIALYQTPLLTPKMVDIISRAKMSHKKPIVVVSTGGDFTEKLTERLEKKGVLTYTFPHNAVRAIKKLVEYYGV